MCVVMLFHRICLGRVFFPHLIVLIEGRSGSRERGVGERARGARWMGKHVNTKLILDVHEEVQGKYKVWAAHPTNPSDTADIHKSQDAQCLGTVAASWRATRRLLVTGLPSISHFDACSSKSWEQCDAARAFPDVKHCVLLKTSC